MAEEYLYKDFEYEINGITEKFLGKPDTLPERHLLNNLLKHCLERYQYWIYYIDHNRRIINIFDFNATSDILLSLIYECLMKRDTKYNLIIEKEDWGVVSLPSENDTTFPFQINGEDSLKY